MSDYQDKPGQTNLFRTKEKRTDKSPDFSGEITLNGIKYWVSLWEKEGPKAGQYFGFSIKEKSFAPAKEAAEKAQVKTHRQDDFEDDIPF